MLDMVETCKAERGVGLAGVQVGDMRRLLVVLLEGQWHHVVNPVIVDRSEDTTHGIEGCLSYPKLTVNVIRNSWIEVEWKTPLGQPCTRKLYGFDAVKMQHEMSHLDGDTILDRASSAKQRKYTGKRTFGRRKTRAERRARK
jgi:peptide deformylase